MIFSMTHEPGDDADHPGDHPLPDDTPPPAPTRRRGDLLRDLGTFAEIQRHLAAVDFTALTAAQRAIKQVAPVVETADILAAQDAIAKSFARSFDFSGLAVARPNFDTGALGISLTTKTQWADALSRAIDFSALHDAIASSAGLTRLLDQNRGFAEALRQQTDVLARITESVTFRLPEIDIPQWIEIFRRWIPGNLHNVQDLEVVATVTLDEGIPLSWIPREDIVVSLVEADGPNARLGILNERRDDILDDCEAGLTSINHEWSEQCRSAVLALRHSLDGPAQSHASNIIDSIILALHGKGGRDRAKERAQDDFDDVPLQLAAENLTLRPLFRAFVPWWPDSGTTPPAHFARHPTAHAVGHSGVFAPLSALIAVMLATSLTMQYAKE